MDRLFPKSQKDSKNDVMSHCTIERCDNVALFGISLENWILMRSYKVLKSLKLENWFLTPHKLDFGPKSEKILKFS